MKEVIKRLLVKLTSSKVLVTIAAIVLLYIIVIGNRVAFKEIGYVCSSCIPVYLGANIVQHKTDKKDE